MERDFSGMSWSRREWLIAAGMGIAARRATAAPSSRVAIARCQAYDPTVVVPTLRAMFDRIGGVGKLVAGKTVAIKINMANPLRGRTGHRAGMVHALDAPGGDRRSGSAVRKRRCATDPNPRRILRG